MVAGKSSQGCALFVDELVGQETVLVRPLQGHLAGIRGVTGCALLSGGQVGMVLDMSYVLGRLDHHSSLSPLQNRLTRDSLGHSGDLNRQYRAGRAPTGPIAA